MFTLLDSVYYRLKKEEIIKGYIKLKKIETAHILQSLTKTCWKYNIQCNTLIKTYNILIVKMTGMTETVVFKYHKTNLVSKDEIDFFMNELDINKAHKGVYITTGLFRELDTFSSRRLLLKKDVMLIDRYAFIKEQLGLTGKSLEVINADKLKFYKYLPQ